MCGCGGSLGGSSSHRSVNHHWWSRDWHGHWHLPLNNLINIDRHALFNFHAYRHLRQHTDRDRVTQAGQREGVKGGRHRGLRRQGHANRAQVVAQHVCCWLHAFCTFSLLLDTQCKTLTGRSTTLLTGTITGVGTGTWTHGRAGSVCMHVRNTPRWQLGSTQSTAQCWPQCVCAQRRVCPQQQQQQQQEQECRLHALRRASPQYGQPASPP